jgi:hypothetical protein
VTKTDYRFTGGHVDNLDDGRVLEPLAKVSLDADQQKAPHAARMISEGLLLEIQKPSTKKEGE